MNARKTTWGIDSRWTRVEPLDDDGRPLGVVSFERRTPPEAWTSPKHLRKRWMLYGMIATAAIWLIGIAGRFVH